MNPKCLLGVIIFCLSCSNSNNPTDDGEKNMPVGGLVAEYLFNSGIVVDNSGNNHDGVNQNALPTIDRNGKAQNALMFNGTNSFVTVALDSSTNPFNFGSSDFAISAWICTKASTIGDDLARQEILSKGDPYNSGYALSMMNNRFSGYVGNTSRIGYNANDKQIADSLWHHVVVQRNNGVVQLFVDLAPQHTYNFSETVTTTYNLIIGKHGTKNQQFFNGSIDNIRIYNRALVTAELTQLFNDSY